MKPLPDTIRISKQGRDQLIKVKRQTGIEHWNILCRWAFVLSLKEPTKPPPIRQKLDGGVEMTWKVFAGDQSDVLSGLLLMRANEDDVGDDADSLAKCLRAHLHRGLSYMASGTDTRSITDFTERWIAQPSGAK